MKEPQMLDEADFEKAVSELMTKMQELFLGQNLGVVVSAMDGLYEVMIDNVAKIDGMTPAKQLVAVRMARVNKLATTLDITQEFIDQFFASGVHNDPSNALEVKEAEQTPEKSND